jgi:hypothetical protein
MLGSRVCDAVNRERANPPLTETRFGNRAVFARRVSQNKRYSVASVLLAMSHFFEYFIAFMRYDYQF